MNNERSTWGSSFGFMMAAIGSAVGLGNIWGFPYKMGKSGGFAFLLIYLVLAVLVGYALMVSELAAGRKTQSGPVRAYKTLSKKFSWIGWLAVIAPYMILSFYVVLGGYCAQYLSLNLAELSFGLQDTFGISLTGGDTFVGMLTNPFGCAMFTIAFVLVCYLINKSDVSQGIEKFNKIGMPCLAIMLLIIIIRSLTLPGAMEGLKFMFVPGYAVKGGFIDAAPSMISVLATAGGQMFFSLSVAMGINVTYGSYLPKTENLKKSALVIVAADTIVALAAGIAVIPAAVANGIANGIPVNEIALGGPKLLFVTLQDVFAQMGSLGPLFGVIFYLLVLIAAISSAIALQEVIAAFFSDRAESLGKTPDRAKISAGVAIAVGIAGLLVAIDGLGASGVFTFWGGDAWNDCLLDFMDCWSEGIALPLGALLMSLLVGWEIKVKPIQEEINLGSADNASYNKFYSFCIRYCTPIAMAFIFSGSVSGFFTQISLFGMNSTTLGYVLGVIILVGGFMIANSGTKEK
ncbi:MAG: sodium-dependent transporter [Clostridiales bacterium]|nr:sodium-dependent transporter [Candidatus Crickella merdequi]